MFVFEEVCMPCLEHLGEIKLFDTTKIERACLHLTRCTIKLAHRKKSILVQTKIVVPAGASLEACKVRRAATMNLRIAWGHRLPGSTFHPSLA